ncbi:MAG TPA: hypothetical protein VFP10_14845 [Candidatus Eisenbacteria bacterium]|nr:hypothetical protein [Candidatus Eisenbacteria bacterium]
MVGATTIQDMNLQDMVTMAPSIVVGTVESSSSRWNDDRSLIVTDVRIRVVDVLKGPSVSEVVITQPGGRVGKLRVDVDGAAAYPVGDEAVLFLASDAKGQQQVLGLSRGRFDIVTDARSGKKTVRGLKASDVATLQASKPGLNDVLASPDSALRMQLDDFLTGVRQLVVNAKGGK